MSAFLDMVKQALSFFVSLGDKVDLFGMNLWQISLIVFSLSCVCRFLFPLIFGSSSSLGGISRIKSSADSYDEARRKENEHYDFRL